MMNGGKKRSFRVGLLEGDIGRMLFLLRIERVSGDLRYLPTFDAEQFEK